MISSTALLSQRLRQHTLSHHDAVAHGDFLTRLTSGDLSREAYTDWLSQLWYVYTALEETVCHAETGALLSCLADSRLQRTHALEADLVHLVGENWLETIVPRPATTVYVDRLFRIGNDEPAVIAHHYVRYLGDLTGGQRISEQVARHYGVSERGRHFSDFAALGSPQHYLADYRSLIDTLPMTMEQTQALLAEANHAFACNAALFTELGEDHRG